MIDYDGAEQREPKEKETRRLISRNIFVNKPLPPDGTCLIAREISSQAGELTNLCEILPKQLGNLTVFEYEDRYIIAALEIGVLQSRAKLGPLTSDAYEYVEYYEFGVTANNQPEGLVKHTGNYFNTAVPFQLGQTGLERILCLQVVKTSEVEDNPELFDRDDETAKLLVILQTMLEQQNAVPNS